MNTRNRGTSDKTVVDHLEGGPEDRLAHLIREAERMLAKSLQARLAKHSIRFGHWAILRILWATEGLTQKELSEEAGVMASTIFGALKTMDEQGLIERRLEDGNRKKVHIYLTRKGRDLREVLVPLAEEVNEIAVRDIALDDLEATRCSLLRIIRNQEGEEIG